MRATRLGRILAAGVGLVAASGCSLLAPSDAELRGSARDAGVALSDASGADGEPTADGGVSYAPLDAKDAWATFDPTSLLAAARGYAGGTFDGSYVYFAPSGTGLVLRCDTRKDFGSAAAWSVFDTTSLDAGATQFTGAIFDGRYVYFVPFGEGHARFFARYDTTGEFSSAGAWAVFDSTTVKAGVQGFVGGTFDGRYLYLAPKANELNNASGLFTRYDTRAPFGDASSWTTFETSALDSTANGFGGAVFDGRFVTLVPFDNELPDSVTVRFDTQASFGAAASYETFALAKLAPSLGGFLGGAFDGRYVYFAPSRPAAATSVVRVDTQGSFASSWSRFDAKTLTAGSGGFAGGAFDGRHVYLVPGKPNAALVRYDTRAAFDVATSWTSFDVGTVSPGTQGFAGAIFDGRALYLVPREGSRAARFGVRAPAELPALPSFHGSFL
ncbi:MAG: hypothetical protein U0235_13020 [Polyangiaceae bacterium]